MKRFFQKFFSLIFFLAILLNNFQPFFYLSFFKKTFAGDNLKVDISFNHQSNKFKIEINNGDANVFGKLNYLLAYQTDKQTEAVQGTEVELNKKENFSKEIYAGTCSKDICTPHKVLRGILKTEINNVNWLRSQLFEIKGGNLVLGEERDVKSLELTEEESSWLENGDIKQEGQNINNEKICLNEEKITNSTIFDWNVNQLTNQAETKEKVKLGVRYIFPLEEKVTVTFKCLPSDESLRTSLKIQKIKISDLNIPDNINPYGEWAYDITTEMKDGSFEYDLTLPKLQGKEGKILYMEDKNGEVKEVEKEKIIEKEDKVEAKELDHLTIFFVDSGRDLTNLLDPEILNASELNQLKNSDDVRYGTNGHWPIYWTLPYQQNQYLEFIFNPNIPNNAKINSVKIIFEYQRDPLASGTNQRDARIRAWDGDGFDVEIADYDDLKLSTYNVDETKTIEVPLNLIDTPVKVNNFKFRFYMRGQGPWYQPWLRTRHDYVALDIDYTLLSNVTVCKRDNNQNPLSAWRVYLLGEKVSSFLVPSDGSIVSSNSAYPTGSYVLLASGTYRYGNSVMIADAANSYRPKGLICAGLTNGWVNGEASSCMNNYLSLNFSTTGGPTAPGWGLYFSPEHKYAKSFSGGNLNLKIWDSCSTRGEGCYGDNEGLLTLDVYKGYVSDTGSDGCVTFENVPYGSYILDEILQDGWERVSQTGNVTIDDENEEFVLTNRKSKISISGQKYNDRNYNGQKDKNEEGLEDWIIYVGQKVDEIEVPAKNSPTIPSNISLENGQKYLLRVSGTYGAGDNITADAKYSVRAPNTYWTDYVQNYESWGPALLDLQINNNSVNWGSYNSNHVYWLIYQGSGSSINFKLYDFYPSNNTGSVRVVIYKVIGETKTDNNGNYNLELNQDLSGEIIIAEETQEGWIQTAPNGNNFGYCLVNFNSSQNNICNFGNALAKGWIIVEKQTIPNASNQLFNFIGSQLSGNIKDGQKLVSNELAPGSYEVTEGNIQGWSLTNISCNDDQSTNPSQGNINERKAYYNLDSGEIVKCTFVNTQTGSISGTKYEDIYANGAKDGNDTGLKNWTIELYDDSNNLKDTTKTDEDGNYSFNNLLPGYYKVCEVQQDGWIKITPTTNCYEGIEVRSGENVTGKNFGNYKLSSIAGIKFEDKNGNGVKDPEDIGLGGWTIYLDKNLNGVLDEGEPLQETASDGSYIFTGLVRGGYHGGYSIREVLKPGWMKTYPSSVANWAVTYSGSVVNGKDFGNFKLGIIQGKKFNDLNIDGNHDNGEPYLNNWTIRLYKKNGNNWDFIDSKLTGHTGTAGQYRFENLTLGQYKICEVLQTGWGQTSPTGNPNNVAGDEAPRCRITSINQSGQSRTGQSFGNVELGSISGTKYEDLNGDGDRGYEQGSEPGLENWTIELYSTSEGKIKSVITDSKGDYWFDNLLPGDYKVCEVLKNGWVNTQPGNGSLCYDINLKPGEDLKKINFGNFKVGKVTVIKFHDRNQDGIKNDGEEVLSGWDINLSSNSGNLLKTTDSSGEAIFDSLLAENYTLSENLKDGWKQTNIYCEGKKGTLIEIMSGDDLSCYIGNYHQPTATLFKSNNTYPNSTTPGSIVTFTLKLKVEGNNLNNVVIKDILPPNFTFNNVWSATLNGNPITLTNPNYSSPGTWNLGDLKEGDEIVIDYQAKANSNIEPGLYKDLAWAVGNETESETSDKILAKAVDSGNSYDSGVVSENFVGTKVNVNKDTQNYTNIDIKKEETKEEEGEVLGVATGLPATGGKAIWLILASFLVILGGVLIGKGFKKKIFKIFNLILVTGLYLLLINNVFAGSLSVRLSEPQSPTRFNNFKLNFVALDLNNNSITVKCFYKKEGGVYAQFDTDKNLTAGGNIGSCQVTSSQINEEGKTYSFYVTATNGIETVNSEVVSVDYKTSVPGTPTNYSKEKSSACEYKIKFKTADDGGLTKKVEIYRSRETSFPLDGSTRVAIIPIGSNTDYTYTNSLSSGYCDDTWYYAVRAFDDAGNGSGWVGDAIITVVTKTTASSTVATVETPTPTVGAIEVTGITLPPAKTTETPEVLGEKTATSEISPTRVEEKKKIKSIGEILGETVKKENKNKLILIVLGILLLGIIGYVYKKKRE